MRPCGTSITAMPSSEASRRNLTLARNHWIECSRNESVLIWRLTLQWWMSEPRCPRTQKVWAAQLDVAQSYVAKMVRRFKRDWLDLALRWPEATLDELRQATKRRKQASAWEEYDAEQRHKREDECSSLGIEEGI